MASVWVDHVPAVRSPPVVLACKVALEGREPVPPVEDDPLDVVVVVPLPPEEEPDLGGYSSPVLAQLPDSGASKRVVSMCQSCLV